MRQRARSGEGPDIEDKQAAEGRRKKKNTTMPRNGRKSVDTALAQANQIATVWKDNPKLVLGDDVALKDFQQAIEDASDADSDFVAKTLETTAARNLRQDRVKSLRSLVTRARSGFRAQFGPDSTQYQQAGGTRLSQRRKPVRLNKRSAAPAQN